MPNWTRATWHECADELDEQSQRFRDAYRGRPEDTATMEEASRRGLQILRALALAERSEQDFGIAPWRGRVVGAFKPRNAEPVDGMLVKRSLESGFRAALVLGGWEPLHLREALNAVVHADPRLSDFCVGPAIRGPDRVHELLLFGERGTDHWFAAVSLPELSRAVRELPDAPVVLEPSDADHCNASVSELAKLPYRVPELQLNGDCILAVERLLGHLTGPNDAADVVGLSEQIDYLLLGAGLRLGQPDDAIIHGAAEEPVRALLAADAAMKLAVALSHAPEREQQREFSFNLLRLNLLLGVAGVRSTIDDEDLKRCKRDWEGLVHCVVGALSDVASIAPPAFQREAMERYSRACTVIFG
jgi:hypothetical protein